MDIAAKLSGKYTLADVFKQLFHQVRVAAAATAGNPVGLIPRAPVGRHRRQSSSRYCGRSSLEGTDLCATGSPGSITVLAASERHGLLHAPDCYLEKIVVGPSCKGAVDLDAPVADNLRNIAKSLDRKVDDLVIVVLERSRHEKLIADIRKAGARIRLISDGDLTPGIASAMIGTGVHAVMGSGGAPEGVLTAAALRCLNGYMVGRLTGYTDEQRERMPNMGIKDVKKIYTAEDLAPGKNIIFAATGVTESPLFRGVRFFGGGFRTSSLVMARAIGSIRFVDTIHVNQTDQALIRFA
jgi:fructose-1,6-bisphosphatase II